MKLADWIPALALALGLALPGAAVAKPATKPGATKTLKKTGKRPARKATLRGPAGDEHKDAMSRRAAAGLGVLELTPREQHRLTELHIGTVGELARAPLARLTPAFGARRGRTMKTAADHYLHQGAQDGGDAPKADEGQRGRGHQPAPAPDLRR